MSNTWKLKQIYEHITDRKSIEELELNNTKLRKNLLDNELELQVWLRRFHLFNSKSQKTYKNFWSMEQRIPITLCVLFGLQKSSPRVALYREASERILDMEIDEGALTIQNT